MRDALGRVPVTIVTGFLGSGKTTLLNHLLSKGGLGRVAALVNDFGAINIDVALVDSMADEVVQLTNGCVCCTINGDLLSAAERMLALELPIDHLIVETTGLADPLPVGLTFLQTKLRSQTSLDSVITVVDCANFALDIFKSDAAMSQIVHGDVIVLNKTDLAAENEIASLIRRISLIKPRTRILRAEYGRVPHAVMLGEVSESNLSGRSYLKVRDNSHLANDGFTAHSFRFDRNLSSERFQAWLDQKLPAGIFRAKGIVVLDSPDRRFVFQLCGSRASFEPYDGPIIDCQLVFIGRDVNEACMCESLQDCLVPVADSRLHEEGLNNGFKPQITELSNQGLRINAVV
jgi:G3E family GTPase